MATDYEWIYMRQCRFCKNFKRGKCDIAKILKTNDIDKIRLIMNYIHYRECTQYNGKELKS